MWWFCGSGGHDVELGLYKDVDKAQALWWEWLGLEKYEDLGTFDFFDFIQNF